jgi:hypothetical protein
LLDRPDNVRWTRRYIYLASLGIRGIYETAKTSLRKETQARLASSYYPNGVGAKDVPRIDQNVTKTKPPAERPGPPPITLEHPALGRDGYAYALIVSATNESDCYAYLVDGPTARGSLTVFDGEGEATSLQEIRMQLEKSTAEDGVGASHPFSYSFTLQAVCISLADCCEERSAVERIEREMVRVETSAKNFDALDSTAWFNLIAHLSRLLEAAIREAESEAALTSSDAFALFAE